MKLNIEATYKKVMETGDTSFYCWFRKDGTTYCNHMGYDNGKLVYKGPASYEDSEKSTISEPDKFDVDNDKRDWWDEKFDKIIDRKKTTDTYRKIRDNYRQDVKDLQERTRKEGQILKQLKEKKRYYDNKYKQNPNSKMRNKYKEKVREQEERYNNAKRARDDKKAEYRQWREEKDVHKTWTKANDKLLEKLKHYKAWRRSIEDLGRGGSIRDQIKRLKHIYEGIDKIRTAPQRALRTIIKNLDIKKLMKLPDLKKIFKNKKEWDDFIKGDINKKFDLLKKRIQFFSKKQNLEKIKSFMKKSIEEAGLDDLSFEEIILALFL